MNKDKCFICEATNNLYLRGKQYVCSNCKDTIQQIIKDSDIVFPLNNQ